jgi:hypothetical protein
MKISMFYFYNIFTPFTEVSCFTDIITENGMNYGELAHLYPPLQ